MLLKEFLFMTGYYLNLEYKGPRLVQNPAITLTSSMPKREKGET
jgi:hypothetical protein